MRLDTDRHCVVSIDRTYWSFERSRNILTTCFVLSHLVLASRLIHEGTLVERDSLRAKRSIEILSLAALMRLVCSYESTLPRFSVSRGSVRSALAIISTLLYGPGPIERGISRSVDLLLLLLWLRMV